MIKASGIAHATLTVSDIVRTKSFYEQLFGTLFQKDSQHSFSLLPVGIPCWFVQSGKPPSGDVFDEKRIGLDHIAFKVEILEMLNEVIERLREMGVVNAGLERFAGKYPYVAFRDPDNIQVEFFIPKEM